MASNDSSRTTTSVTNNTMKKLKTCVTYFIVVLTLVFVGGLMFSQMEEPVAIEAIQQRKNQLQLVKQYFDNNETILLYLKENYHVFDDNSYRNNWGLHSSSFFAFTIATTIGYGSFAPVTNSGKVFVIFYGLIAIPITGACLVVLADTALYFMRKLIATFSLNKMKNAFHEIDADNSQSLDKDEVKLVLKQLNMDVNNDTFDQVWLEISTGDSNELNFHQFIELKEKLNLDIDELSQRKSKATITVIAIILCAEMISSAEKWAWGDALYFATVTMTTVGLGDFAPNTSIGRSLTILTSIVGLGLIAILLSIIGEAIAQKTAELGKQAEKNKKKASSYLELVTVESGERN
eukprot:g709.t1